VVHDHRVARPQFLVPEGELLEAEPDAVTKLSDPDSLHDSEVLELPPDVFSIELLGSLARV